MQNEQPHNPGEPSKICSDTGFLVWESVTWKFSIRWTVVLNMQIFYQVKLRNRQCEFLLRDVDIYQVWLFCENKSKFTICFNG